MHVQNCTYYRVYIPLRDRSNYKKSPVNPFKSSDNTQVIYNAMYVDEDSAITMNTAESESSNTPLPDIKHIENPLYQDDDRVIIEHHIYETLPMSHPSYDTLEKPYDSPGSNVNEYDLLSCPEYDQHESDKNAVYEEIDFPVDNNRVDIYNSNIFN